MESIFLIGSFRASSVLIFGAIQSPLVQPRNFIGGQLISALIGVTIFKFGPNIIWTAAPLAVATSIIAMQITKTLHPPGGATALIAVIGTEKIKVLGYFYIISPVLTGCLILFIIALIFNNVTKHRKYPTNSGLTRVFKSKGLNKK
ncbi:HPP family protein [Flavivirga sp. 57AJ16]|uniref:HPP family protein n=1 Tax=Flavivirga sp. 57AJ16 TaxID=3025307 RepID=UPI0030826675